MDEQQAREGIPPNARRVFKGVIFEVWQWDQKVFDGTTQVFEKIWRPSTVEIIATVGDKILIEEQDQPDRPNNINFPSGRVENENNILGEAKRELLEETGYQSDDWFLSFEHGRWGKIIQHVYYFIARNCTKIKEPQLDAGEKIQTKLITLDELIMLADEPRFWVAKEFINHLVHLQYDSKKKEEFKKLLFPK